MQQLSAQWLLHQQRIRSFIAGQSTRTFPVQDTCRLDNSGLLSIEHFAPEGSLQIVAFTPAAGAASRYFKPLDPLHKAVQSGDKAQMAAAAAALKQEGALLWPLPDIILDAIDTGSTNGKSDELLAWLDAPKALLPHKFGAEDFLTVKFQEHEALPWIKGQVFVTSEGKNALFERRWLAYQALTPSSKKAIFLEQNAEMCTIRFDAQGEPVQLDDGAFSSVPAGHGTLTKLFPTIAEQFPGVDAIFIKNIDNVVPRTAESQKVHGQFFAAYGQALNLVKKIRSGFKGNNVATAEEAAESLLALWPQHKSAQPTAGTALEQELAKFAPRSLAVLQHLFHASTGVLGFFATKGKEPTQLFERLFNRPVNMLGQVPNSGKDIGGTAVFAKTSHGLQKICLELPHFSPADRELFLHDPKKATHFNPVFVAAELVSDGDAYENADSPFWIIAEKTFHGKPVYYHETVLYELLGNSLFTNCLFSAVPRLVFQPHKTLLDSLGPV